MTTKKMGRDSSAARKTSCKRNSNASSSSLKALIAGASRWLCRKLCHDKFFNHDASREIDRLLAELDNLRAEAKK